MTRKERIRQTNKETIIIFVLYFIFFAWWYLTAYGFGDDPSKYKYIFGFPEWFFLSCIVGYAAITVLLWAAIKIFFKEIPFDDDGYGSKGEKR